MVVPPGRPAFPNELARVCDSVVTRKSPAWPGRGLDHQCGLSFESHFLMVAKVSSFGKLSAGFGEPFSCEGETASVVRARQLVARAERCRLARQNMEHLARSTPATSPRNHTHVLVHWESCLQGLENPSVIRASRLVARAERCAGRNSLPAPGWSGLAARITRSGLQTPACLPKR